MDRNNKKGTSVMLYLSISWEHPSHIGISIINTKCRDNAHYKVHKILTVNCSLSQILPKERVRRTDLFDLAKKIFLFFLGKLSYIMSRRKQFTIFCQT